MAKTTGRGPTVDPNVEIRHQIYLQRYSDNVVRRMIALMNRTDIDISNQILALGPDSPSQFALEQTLANVRALQNNLTLALQHAISMAAVELGANEAEFMVRLGQGVFGARWHGPTVEQIRAAALSRPFQSVHLAWANLNENMTEWGNRRLALVRDTVRRGYVQGKSVDQIVRDLRGTKALQYRDGLLERTRLSTEAIVRTALNHTANAAREEVYKLNADQLRGVRWTSILDGRTSAICRARDGEIYPIDDGPRPPAHPNCRSITVPVFRGEGDPDMPSYADWLREQPREFVEETLGKDKAALFLDGDLPLDRFVDNSGHEYTLDELRTRDADAFEKAGL